MMGGFGLFLDPAGRPQGRRVGTTKVEGSSASALASFLVAEVEGSSNGLLGWSAGGGWADKKTEAKPRRGLELGLGNFEIWWEVKTENFLERWETRMESLKLLLLLLLYIY